jgi:hypothetical protein
MTPLRTVAAAALLAGISTAPAAALVPPGPPRILNPPAVALPVFYDRARSPRPEPGLPVVLFDVSHAEARRFAGACPIPCLGAPFAYSYPAYRPAAVFYPIAVPQPRLRRTLVVPGRRYFPGGGRAGRR